MPRLSSPAARDLALELVSEHAPVVVGLYGADGTVLDMFGAAMPLLGVDPDKVVGRHYSELGWDPETLYLLASALVGQAVEPVAYLDGGWALHGCPLWRDGEVVGAATLFTPGADRSLTQTLGDRQRELEKFAALVELSSDFIAMAEPDGTVTYLNQAGRELVGISDPAEALGRPTDDYFTDAGRAKSREVEEAVLAQGFWEGESELHHFGTGESIPVSVNSFLVTDQNTGEPTALATVQRDLRTRIQSEERLAKRLQAQRWLADLGRLALNEPLPELMPEVVRLVEAHLPSLRCAVLQRSGDGAHLVMVATDDDTSDGLTLPIDPGTVSGSAMTQDRTTYTSDVAADSRFADVVASYGVRAVLTAPVPGADAPWGVVAVAGTDAHDWSDDDIAFVESVASTLGAAVRRAELEEELQHQALHDPLTGLPNRALVLDRIHHALSRAKRHRSLVAVLLLDLDDFKTMNDSLGHNTGDELLVEVGRRLREAVSPGDTVSRLGGDEFVVVCEDVVSVDDVAFRAEALLAACDTDFDLAGRTINFSASVGVALAAGGEASTTGLLGEADIAMYRAKRDRPGTYRVFDEAMRGEVLGRMNTAGELRTALRGKGLDVVYQPIVALSSGRIIALEALARWTTPTGASVSPEVFIPVAEETGLIGELGAQILRMAARDAASWQSIAPTGVRVNVSAHEIRGKNFYSDVMRTLEFAELDPKLLGLEITESVLVQEGSGAEETLGRLRDAGITLMLDDFGTGYSSLSYLQRFPVVDMLKIDRSFLTDDEQGEAVVQAVIGLGRAFGLKVCAEGVENASQHNRVVKLGCDYAQGYYFARPIAGELVPKLLESWAPFLPA